MIAAVEVSAKPDLLVEHAVLHLVDGVTPRDQGVHARLEVLEDDREAGTGHSQGGDDEDRDRGERSRQPLREAAI